MSWMQGVDVWLIQCMFNYPSNSSTFYTNNDKHKKPPGSHFIYINIHYLGFPCVFQHFNIQHFSTLQYDVSITFRRNRREGQKSAASQNITETVVVFSTHQKTLCWPTKKKRFHSLMKQISITKLAMNTEALLEALTPTTVEEKLLKLLSDLSS